MVAALKLPGVAEYLVYDRGALARGELWRVFSAHMVHYSGAHLLANVLVLLPAALLVEVRYRVDFLRILVVSAVAIGVGTALAIWVVRSAKRVQVSGIRPNSVLD